MLINWYFINTSYEIIYLSETRTFPFYETIIFSEIILVLFKKKKCIYLCNLRYIQCMFDVKIQE